MKPLHLIGCASGVAGADVHSGDGPLVLQRSPYLKALNGQEEIYQWDKMFHASSRHEVDDAVRNVCSELAQEVSALIQNKTFFSVIGGDHSCAIGTWSGAYDALHAKGDIGLIWIDAHMDSHTPETSETGNVHGMPLAVLLGYGSSKLTSILHAEAKIKPENLCLIGVRSFEAGEAELLAKLNVRVYMMDEVTQRGFAVVMQEAVAHVTRHTIGYGVTLDIDSVDPLEAPGVDVPEPDGIHANDLCAALQQIAHDPRLITTEIVEFDPTRDKQHLTEKLVVKLLNIIANGKAIAK